MRGQEEWSLETNERQKMLPLKPEKNDFNKEIKDVTEKEKKEAKKYPIMIKEAVE